MRLTVLASIVALTTPGVTGWGDVGHRTVGYLAEKYFTPKAAAIYADILANDLGYDISDAATWADTIKPKMPWSKPYHYISMSLTFNFSPFPCQFLINSAFWNRPPR